jgi:hypothetical protein
MTIFLIVNKIVLSYSVLAIAAFYLGLDGRHYIGDVYCIDKHQLFILLAFLWYCLFEVSLNGVSQIRYSYLMYKLS